MTYEHIIIGTLFVCLCWQTWRKRVWKMRAILQIPGFWQAVKYKAVNQEWPEVIDNNAN